MVTVEIGCADGLIVLAFTDDRDGDEVCLAMTGDQARELCNSLGEAILCTSRARVMT